MFLIFERFVKKLSVLLTWATDGIIHSFSRCVLMINSHARHCELTGGLTDVELSSCLVRESVINIKKNKQNRIMESNRAVLHRVVKERPHGESDILAET